MKYLGTFTRTALVATALVAGTATAGELRYTPINPAFGGNPFNGSHLMARAAAQNDQERPTAVTSSTDNLRRTIQNSVLNRTAFAIADRIFTPDSANFGVTQNAYTDGNTRIEYVQNGTGGVTIIITDLTTNEVTTVSGFTDAAS